MSWRREATDVERRDYVLEPAPPSMCSAHTRTVQHSAVSKPRVAPAPRVDFRRAISTFVCEPSKEPDLRRITIYIRNPLFAAMHMHVYALCPCDISWHGQFWCNKLVYDICDLSDRSTANPFREWSSMRTQACPIGSSSRRGNGRAGPAAFGSGRLCSVRAGRPCSKGMSGVPAESSAGGAATPPLAPVHSYPG